MASSADDLVSYYKRALASRFFTKRATFAEFKRIHLTNAFFPDDTVGALHVAFSDPSGGPQDAMTLAIAHKEATLSGSIWWPSWFGSRGASDA